MEDQVILVDERDAEIGTAGKLAAHVDGRLHRAISVFLFDAAGRLLLQQRAAGKYHSAGLWSNTCCSHPRPGEPRAAAARRRLREEMGIDCALEEQFGFIYRAELPNRLIEHEYDYVYFGRFDGSPTPAPDEVALWSWMDLAQLRVELKARPQAYTYWLGDCFERVARCFEIARFSR